MKNEIPCHGKPIDLSHLDRTRTTTTEDARHLEAIREDARGGMAVVALGVIVILMAVMFIGGFIAGRML